MARTIGQAIAETREFRGRGLDPLERARIAELPIGLFVAGDERSAVLIRVPAAARKMRLPSLRDVDLGLERTIAVGRVGFLHVDRALRSATSERSHPHTYNQRKHPPQLLSHVRSPLYLAARKSGSYLHKVL